MRRFLRRLRLRVVNVTVVLRLCQAPPRKQRASFNCCIEDDGEKKECEDAAEEDEVVQEDNDTTCPAEADVLFRGAGFADTVTADAVDRSRYDTPAGPATEVCCVAPLCCDALAGYVDVLI